MTEMVRETGSSAFYFSKSTFDAVAISVAFVAEIEAVEGAADGYISAVNLAEVYYVVRAIDTEDRADAVVGVLEETGITRVDTAETWRRAADVKYRHSPALGDAFALATADHVDGVLLVGDDDYDDITTIPIRQFRAMGV